MEFFMSILLPLLPGSPIETERVSTSLLGSENAVSPAFSER